jgi:hypothetical protein
MKYSVLALLMMLSLFSFSQDESQPHGTVVVGIICSDGIILAADSRSSYKKFAVGIKDAFVYAYIDSFRKIFTLGKFKLAVVGKSDLKDKSWESVTMQYNKLNKSNDTVEAELNNFLSYLKTKIKIPDSLLLENQFLLAGYEKGRPVIISKTPTGKQKIEKIGHRLISNDCTLIGLRTATATNCTAFSKAIEFGFNQCSKNDISVGGPINIIQIKSDNSVNTIKTFKFKEYKTESASKKLILAKKIKVEYLYPQSESYLREQLLKN